MELKEYLQIIRRNIMTFFVVVAVFVFGTFLFFSLKPITYSVSLGLNITRSGAQQTTDYKYDDFYRLQADEKFVETIVEWMRDPRMVADIYSAAGIDSSKFNIRQLSKSFSPQKLSSQFVSISFSSSSIEKAKKISGAVVMEVSHNTDDLNKNQNENNWFEIIAQDPIVTRDRVSPIILLLSSLIAGFFMAFFVVLIIHYLK
jgi:capsular polysaccharide biosynthesis protein